MKIFVTGTRGIPDIPGGVETHCRQLYPLIALYGHEVIVATRKPYVTEMRAQWQGIRLQHLYAPRRKSLEAIVHTFMAIHKALSHHPDILHIHAIGPGLLVPLARILGLKVVVTNHGPDYDRQKWGRMARAVLRLAEWAGGKFANQVIVISRIIKDTIQRRCGREATIIYNGVSLAEPSTSTDFTDSLGVQPCGYILAVARLVPEKGLDLLIEAFKHLPGDYKLVIAGDADHETAYSRALKKTMAADERIVHTGYISGEPLRQVFSHAALFVLPSFHEGLPITLLEAMSYGLPVLVSDIPANLEVELPEYRYFSCGNVDDLVSKMRTLVSTGCTEQEKRQFMLQILEKYNWLKIAEQTLTVYNRVLTS